MGGLLRTLNNYITTPPSLNTSATPQHPPLHITVADSSSTHQPNVRTILDSMNTSTPSSVWRTTFEGQFSNYPEKPSLSPTDDEKYFEPTPTHTHICQNRKSFWPSPHTSLQQSLSQLHTSPLVRGQFSRNPCQLHNFSSNVHTHTGGVLRDVNPYLVHSTAIDAPNHCASLEFAILGENGWCATRFAPTGY